MGGRLRNQPVQPPRDKPAHRGAEGAVSAGLPTV